MKGILALLFFLVCTAVGATGVVLAASGKGLGLLVVSFVVYLGILVKWGCLSEVH
ncbi:MAG: hypothetical protein U1G08_01980 [Verrucomicrobiota bacterium]